MKLFKKNDKRECCCGNYDDKHRKQSPDYKQKSRIKVLGTGCMKCRRQEEYILEALKELGRMETIEHVRNPADIAGYGVISTPAVVIDDRVVSFGRVLSPTEILELLERMGF